MMSGSILFPPSMSLGPCLRGVSQIDPCSVQLGVPKAKKSRQY